MEFDPIALLAEILAKLKDSVGKDWSKISVSAEKHAQALAYQASWIAEEALTGILKDNKPLFDQFMAQLRRQAENFVLFLISKTMLLLESAWNSVVALVWAALDKTLTAATGGWVRVPNMPKWGK